jgi:diaminohydroxyphosphoribosylaminopyrimidine deaminase/5-amino-6-(5-phosphoribosylamino)uracil reductase
VHALRAAGDRARGGTALVTLEPCAHVGSTGACAQALIDAGVRRVLYAVADPNPVAAGGGRRLTAAGIAVECGLGAAEAERANEAWLTAVRLGRAYLTWKYGSSLDGRVAAADGSSRWITSAESRADAHRLRAQADAVLVGSGTLRADDPQLAVRHVPLLRPTPPLRVVVDTEAGIRPGARVLDAAAPTLVVVAADATVAAAVADRAEVLRLSRAAGRGLDLAGLLATLRAREVMSVLLEGGPTLAGAFLAAGLVDRVVGYLAPAFIGAAGRPVLDGWSAATIDGTARLELDQVIPVGPDIKFVARPVGRQPATTLEGE